MKLSSRVSILSGVGPVLQRGLKSVRIETIKELLDYYPRRWEEYKIISRIDQITPGLVCINAKVETISMRRSPRRQGLIITEAILSDHSGTLKAVWFNQPYLVRSLIKGNTYQFRGKFEFKNNYLSLQNPTFEKAKPTKPQSIIPIYPENKHVTSATIRKLIAQCIEQVNQIPNVLPDEVIKAHNLISKAQAISQLHRPKSSGDLELAKRTVSFEELFLLVLSGLIIKTSIKTERSPKIKYDSRIAKKFTEKLEFRLTDAQRKAAHIILQDMDSSKPMNRLLEGDVGSGKTLVALMVVVMAAKSAFQSAIMVPTEILAQQHFNNSKELLRKMGVKSELLISALKKTDRAKVLNDLKAGKIDCVIGTHALISDDVEYKNLGLVVVDEQHRFGVNQRRALKKKAKFMPHVLTMTATPIPRSLALVVYGDLDISVIDEMPPGRKPVITRLVEECDRTQIYTKIDSLIEQGQQAYVVCPLISESDKLGVKSVEAEFDRMQRSVFTHRKIGVIHGRLKTEEKSKIMDQFKARKLDMLISTSVIEVGVDVPNATIMLVEGAERFGLAALHQLRGRVGRGQYQSYCYLFTSSDNDQTLQRLKALEKTNDGFRLAQIDLEIRGPGEIYGTAQHGILDLRLADLFDHRLVSEVKKAANTFLKNNNLLEYDQLVKHVNQLKKIVTLD